MEIYINVRNFVKIKNARINIGNFTVFVDNNNSGKTQLMELIYAIIKKIAALTPMIDFPHTDDIDVLHVGTDEVIILNKFINYYLKENIADIIDDTFNSYIPIDEVSIDLEQIDCEYDIYFLKGKTMEYAIDKHMLTESQLSEIAQNEQKNYASLTVKNGVVNGITQWYSTKFPIQDTILLYLTAAQ